MNATFALISSMRNVTIKRAAETVAYGEDSVMVRGGVCLGAL